MADVWSKVAELDRVTQERLAEVLETRGADAQQRNLRRAFLAGVPFPTGARVLEVGCGTGVLTRVLATWPDVASVVGVDLAPSLLERAGELVAGMPHVTLRQADARALPFDDGAFDVVVFDSTLVHVPEPERAVGEAARVLGSGGVLAAFEGDYATTTVALSDHDPLQRCADVMMSESVTDRWLVRRLPALVRDHGLVLEQFVSHGFVDTAEDGYMVTVIDRGADLLAGSGEIGAELAAALKGEARRRASAGRFFGHVAYASLIARVPA